MASHDECLSVMLLQERTTYACGDCFRGRRSSRRKRRSADRSPQDVDRDASPGRRGVTPEDRTRIVDWCYAIVDRCRFDRESVACAMSAVDRFLTIPPRSPKHAAGQAAALADRSKYQLLAVAALYVCLKVREPSVVSSGDFSAASRGTYSREDVEATERDLLEGLDWRVCPPTAVQAAYRLLDLVEARGGGAGGGRAPSPSSLLFDALRDEASYRVECAVRDAALSSARPSTIGAAAVLDACHQVKDHVRRWGLVDALASVLGEYDFEGRRAVAMARDRLRSLVEEEGEASSDQQAAPVEVEEEEASEEEEEEELGEGDAMAASGHSLTQVDRLGLGDIQDGLLEAIQGPYDCYDKVCYGEDVGEGVMTASFVSVPSVDTEYDDDVDSCATVHY